VDVASRGTAGCRYADCPGGGAKIAKGELRLGICVPFDGEHSSWVYKHWKCMSNYDLEAIRECYDQDSFEVPDTLPEDLQKVVVDTLENGEAVEPPKIPEPSALKPQVVLDTLENGEVEPPNLPEPASAPKPENRKQQITDDRETEAPTAKPKPKSRKKQITNDDSETEEPKPKPKTKGKGRKRASAEVDPASEAEYVPKKTRSRRGAAPMGDTAGEK